MFGRGSFGVGRCTHRLAGSAARSAATFFGSAIGTSFANQAGSYGPVRRSVEPGLTPYFLVPASSILLASMAHFQVLPSLATTSTSSRSLTAARRKPLLGPSGVVLPSAQRASSCHPPLAVSNS